MRAVNLLPKNQSLAGGLAGNRPRLLIIGVATAIAAMGFWAYSASQSADSVAAQVIQAQAQKAALDQQVAALAVYRQRQQALAAQAVVVGQLASARIDWERVIRDVVTVLPSGVWVNTINGSLPTTSTTSSGANSAAPAGTLPQPDTTAPQGLHIVGDAFTQGEVADTLSRLATVPGLGAPRLASSQTTTTSNKTIIAFTIDVPVNAQALDVSAAPAGASAATTATRTGGTP
jgi:Tfp pilus assembly protein PilN